MSDRASTALLATGMTAFYAVPLAARAGVETELGVLALLGFASWALVARRAVRAPERGSFRGPPLAWLLVSAVPSVLVLTVGPEALPWVGLAIPFVVLLGVMTCTIVTPGTRAAITATVVTAGFVAVWVALPLTVLGWGAGAQVVNGVIAGMLPAVLLLAIVELCPR